MKKYITKKEKEKLLDHLYDNILPKNKILWLLENGKHSYGMIYDYIEKYHRSFIETNSITKRMLCKWLKEEGFKYNCDLYLKTTNTWKLQYKYTKEQCKYFERNGQKKTARTRKDMHDKGLKPYNPQHTIKYWIGKSGSLKEAEVLLYKNKRKWSPFCREFYIERGHTKEETKEILTELQVLGAVSALKKMQKPKTEKKLACYLTDNKIEYSSQYRIHLKTKEKLYRKHYYVYDFYVPRYNLLIECNGSYWHCDPRFYEGDDLVKRPGVIEKIRVKNIWNIDKHKEDIATKHGYNFLTIWEHDINNNNYNSLLEVISG